ncbi:hypothetical protein U9M48_024747 [Paspalum notatum var. saurae]|uniref:Reverse transcriptase zinc-binding domain-containing protein n=1 Tax=Paspalum notatum var. saurae TaxID=547442 RepID=A0AAQ3TP89_PASNO
MEAVPPSSTFSPRLAPTMVYSRRRAWGSVASAAVPTSSPMIAGQHSFVARVTKKIEPLLPPPVIHRKKSLVPPPTSVPWRSRQVAGVGPCFPKPVVTDAQRRIIRSLGFSDAKETIDLKAQDEYFKLLDQPLTDVCLAALAALSGWTVGEGDQNARGLNRRDRQNSIRDKFVCLQETKVAAMSQSLFLSFIGQEEITWWFTRVYDPQEDDDKVLFMQQLRDVRSLCSCLWLVTDKNNNNLNWALMGRFKRFLDDMEIKKLPLVGRKFTWSNERSSPTLVRLDRVFCCTVCDDLFPDSLLYSAASVVSDHCPLLLGLKVRTQGKRRFHFKGFWPKLLGFMEAVEQNWNAPVSAVCPVECFFIKLQRLSKGLQKWSQRKLQQHDLTSLEEGFTEEEVWRTINDMPLDKALGLDAIPIHVMLALDLPKWVIKTIDKLRRGFLWVGCQNANGGNCLVSWEKVQRPLQYGGLGVPHNAQALFHVVVETKDGNGVDTKFWTDRWLYGSIVGELAPNLLRLIPKRTRRQRSVSQALTNRRWVADIQGALTVQLWELVEGFTLQPALSDQHIWKITSSGQYTSKSAYNTFLGSVKTWKTWAPLRCKFFIWLAIKNKVWTADRLLKHGLPHPSEDESIQHILVSSVFSRESWTKILPSIGLQAAAPQTERSFANWRGCAVNRVPKEKRKGFNSLVILVAWTIWKHRNACVFEGLSPSM